MMIKSVGAQSKVVYYNMATMTLLASQPVQPASQPSTGGIEIL